MLKKVFQFQVFSCLALLQLCLSADDCVIDSSKILTVPTGGCTLVRSENEIVVDKLVLNGELLMDKMNHLKYKSMEVNAGAALKITSKYETVVFEDIGDDPCDLAGNKVNQIQLSFKSRYKNTFYEIQSVSNQNELLVVNRNPFFLYKGAKVVVMFNEEVEYSEVDYVDGQKVFLKTSLTGSYHSFLANINEFYEIHPKLFLLDERSIFFRNNCLNVKGVFNVQGAVFEDLKGLNYESNDSSLQQVLFMKTTSSASNKFNYFRISVKVNPIENIVLIGDIKQIFFQNVKQINSLSLLNIKDILIKIENRENSAEYLIGMEVYSSNVNISYSNIKCQLQIKFLKLIYSKASFEGIPDQFDNSFVSFSQSILYHSTLEKITGYQGPDFFFCYFQTSIIDLSYLNVESDIILDHVNIEGSDLPYAVKLPNAIRNFWINESGFFGFKNAEQPIFFFPSLSYQESQNSFNKVYPLNEIKFPVLIQQINLIDCHKDIKLIQLPNMIVKFQSYGDGFRRFQAVSLPDSVYKNKPIARIFKPWLTNKPLYYVPDGNNQQLSTLYLSFGDQSLNSLFQIKLTTQNGEGIYNLGEHFYLINSFSYRITVALIPGQTLQNTNLKLQVQTDFYQTYFLQNSLTILIDAAPYAIKTITNGGQSYSEAIINDLDKGIYITQTVINIVDLLEMMNLVYSISFCPSGQVNEGGSCVSSCNNSNIVALYGQCFNTAQKDYYYFDQDSGKSLLVSCPINCLKCTNNPLKCQSCKFSYGSVADNCREYQMNEYNNSSTKSLTTCTMQDCGICNAQQCFFCKQDYAFQNGQYVSCVIVQENQSVDLNQLITCPQNCKKCINELNCLECLEGFELIFGRCQTKCLEQNQYFDLDLQKCVQCRMNVLSCQNYNTICSSNYYLEDKTSCKVSDLQNQKICDGQVCYECYDTQNLDGCSSPFLECEKGFSHKIGSDVCVQCTGNCADCDLPNNCIQCIQNYEPIQGVCSKCQSGFFQNIGDKKCQQCDSSCKECIDTKDNCTSCKNNQYEMKDGKCILKSCQKNYFLDSNDCKECPIGTFSNLGDTKCQDCDLSCRSCTDTKNQCTSCNSGFLLKNTSCEQCDLNCKECENEITQCTACKNGNFELQDHKCVKKLCGEGEYKDKGECKQCLTGFFSNEGDNICSECDKSCKECSISKDKCVSCHSNQFKLVENKCVKSEDDDSKSENNSLDDNSEESLDDGQIIGIVLGSVFGSLFIILIISTCCRYYKANLFVRSKSNQQILPTQNEKQSIINTDRQQIQTQVLQQ